MSKYTAPPTAPFSPADVFLELQRIEDAMSELTTDTVLFKKWNEEPSKVYDGLTAYADGTNWNPGSAEGAYIYYAAAWNFLG